jgi:hypothetical protein
LAPLPDRGVLLCPAGHITACSFTANGSPYLAGALQVRDAAHVVISATTFFNNTSLKTELYHDEGSAISIHNNSTGEDDFLTTR